MIAQIFNVPKGHSRFGFCRMGGKVVFYMGISDEELPPGKVPEDFEEESEPLTGFVIHSYEQLKMLGEYFIECAEGMEKEGWFDMPPTKAKRACVCGRKILEMFAGCGMYTIKCPECGREAYGKNRSEVVDNWNEMIRKEREDGGC